MFENRGSKAALIIAGIVVAFAIAFTTQPLFIISSTTHTQSSNIVQANSNSVNTSHVVIRGPPAPLPITIWGKQDYLTHAKNVTGMSWVSLPIQVPPNLTLAPIRVRNDQPSITAIYIPSGITISDNDTSEKIASVGGFSITYLKQLGGPTFNMSENMIDISKQQPNTYLENINGHQALVFPNEIQINAGNCMNKVNCWLLVIIGSKQYNSTELTPIAESIAIPSHN